MRSEGLLELGKRLVSELELERSTDTLGRWMAHYIAELIDEAEHAEAKEREEASTRCFDAILRLWSHRSAMPPGRRPFEDAEPILRALASLDPNETDARYFRLAWISEPQDEQETAAKRWLSAGTSLDHTARLLIRYCLAQAAEAALDKSKEWVKLAEAAGKDDEVEVLVIRFIAAEQKLLHQEPVEEVIYRILKDRIEQLSEFIAMAKIMSQELQMTLGKYKGDEEEKKWL